MSTTPVFDRVINEIDTALRTLLPPAPRLTKRAVDGLEKCPVATLSEPEKKHVAGLMRVNHSGEVCAQALYQGQALTANLAHIKEQMTQAAEEEIDHLAWCEKRLDELEAKPSLLNPIWYAGSLLLGAAAGLAGDKWSLGFVAETERQVGAHLESHLQKLPAHDTKSALILKHMQQDEAELAQTALAAGGAPLPSVIQKLMAGVSKVMTKTSYYF